MENVTVFGGAGFLGSHVADELSERGYRVKIFDRIKSPYLLPEQEMIIGDILDKKAVHEAVSQSDYIYNYAGLADINDAKEKPELTAQLNIMGNLHILEACRFHQVKRFIFASSVYVFSESGSFYRASKQASENFVELYYEKFALPYTILRYGSIYGRRADNRNAIYRFIESALREGKIKYQGSGEELREYVHANDAACLSVDILKESYANKHFVITGNNLMKVADVMQMISEILKEKDIELMFDNKDIEAHYNITPYTYKPKIGKKIIANPFVDMGQGILDCIHELVKKDS
jgi:UDP-glucose 4-epimerase